MTSAFLTYMMHNTLHTVTAVVYLLCRVTFRQGRWSWRPVELRLGRFR